MIKNKIFEKILKLSYALLGIIIAAIIITFALLRAYNTTKKIQTEQIQNRLEEIAESESNYIQVYMENIINHMNYMALTLSKFEDEYSDEAFEYLEDISNQAACEKYLILKKDGEYKTTLKEKGSVDLSELEEIFFNNSGAKISKIFIDKNTDKRKIGLFVPIVKKGEYNSILCTIYETQTLEKIVLSESFYKNGYSHIFQKDGDYVIRSSNLTKSFDATNFYDGYKNAKFIKGDNFKRIFESIQNNERAFVSYVTARGEERYGYYMPAGFSDWYVFTAVPTQILNEYEKLSNSNMTVLALEIFFGMFVLAMCIIIDYIKQKKKMKMDNKMLENSENRFRTAVSHTACVVYEYNYKTDKTRVLSSYLELEQERLEIKLMHPEESDGLIYEEDQQKYEKHCKRIKNGKKIDTCNIRLKLYADSSDYRWYKISMTNIFGKEDTPTYAVGTLEDINSQRMLEISLKEHMKRDILTGLYTRSEFENIAEKILKRDHENEPLSLAIVDIDDFGKINETYGYTFGDRLLIAISQKIREIFADALIIGRLGGDNFAILAKFKDPEEEMLKRIANLKMHIEKIIRSEQILISANISVGLSKTYASENYSKLLKKSESALQSAKKTGKNKTVIDDTIFSRKE